MTNLYKQPPIKPEDRRDTGVQRPSDLTQTVAESPAVPAAPEAPAAEVQPVAPIVPGVEGTHSHIKLHDEPARPDDQVASAPEALTALPVEPQATQPVPPATPATIPEVPASANPKTPAVPGPAQAVQVVQGPALVQPPASIADLQTAYSKATGGELFDSTKASDAEQAAFEANQKAEE